MKQNKLKETLEQEFEKLWAASNVEELVSKRLARVFYLHGGAVASECTFKQMETELDRKYEKENLVVKT